MPSSEKIVQYWSEQTVFEALRIGHFVEGATVLLPQVRSATGAGAARTADAIAMQLWPSRGLTIEGVEIKTARSDFLRELGQPDKSDLIATFCSKWWIAAPNGVVTAKDIEDESWPPLWGWLEVGGKIQGEKGAERPAYWAKVRRKPKENENVREPTRLFLASVLRSLQAHESPDAIINRRAAAIAQAQTTRISAEADKRINEAQEQLQEIRRRVQMFENTVGLSTGVFTSAWSPETLEAKHADGRRKIQMANSLATYLDDAAALAVELDRMGTKIEDTSKRMKLRSQRLQEFIASHKLGKSETGDS